MTFGFRDENWYLLDVMRARMRYPLLLDRVIAQSKLWHADKVLLEDAEAGLHLWQDLWQRRDVFPFRIRPEGDKVTRMVGQLAMIEDGRLHLPIQAPWLNVMLNELGNFPAGRHDDQVDALPQFLKWIKTRPDFGPSDYDPGTGRRIRPSRRERPSRRGSIRSTTSSL